MLTICKYRGTWAPGVGNVETHTDRPRCSWGIGFGLGCPEVSKKATRLSELELYYGLPGDVSCANVCSHGRNSAFLQQNRPKTKLAWSEGGKGWFWHEGEGGCWALLERFLPTRDPHPPPCRHSYTHFKETHISNFAKCGW